MKKNVIGFLSLSLVIELLAGCKASTSFSSSSSSTSSITPPPASFEQVLENTAHYNLYFKYDDYDAKFYHELNGATYYTYIPSSTGYAILDSDPGFTHFFSFKKDTTNGLIDIEMNGRYCSADDFMEASRSTSNTTFIELLTDYKDLFQVDESNPWKYTMYQFAPAKDFKNFFQLSEFGYCDYYEVNVGEDGRIESFKAGETFKTEDGETDYIITESLYFEPGNFENVYFYQNWKENGCPIVERVMDYKTFYNTIFGPRPCYNSGNVDAIVAALDYDGSFYIANHDNVSGPIGMRVTPKNPVDIKVGDKVNVSGDIVMDLKNSIYTACPRFVNAEVSVIGHDYVVPQFSEESIVDTYAPGVYAVQMLVRSPVYGSSIYSGYGYASNIPATASTTGDTIIDIVCPDYFYEADKSPFLMKLHIPQEYGAEKINEVLEECRNAGDYAVNPQASKVISFQNVVSMYSFERPLSLDLYAVPTSIISHRLTYTEMIKNDFGYDNFPELTSQSGGAFHFGDNANWYVEDQYNVSTDKHLTGVFSFHQGCTAENIQQYFTDLVDYGAHLVDIYSLHMTSFLVHYIYAYEDLFLDIMYQDYAGSISQVQIFVYRAEKEVRCKNICEKINEACGSYFKGEEFIKLPNTNDRDYHLYPVPSFAGNEFGTENPLYIATLDILPDRYDELREAYRNAGWKVYRNEDGKAFSYITRGLTRNVYYKENENGKKTFLDFGCYPKSDYTFLGCDAFNQRIEIAIYEGDTPISTQYTRDMTHFMKTATQYAPGFYFDWTLPEKYKMEYYSSYPGVDMVDFGYCHNMDDIFIYPQTSTNEELDALYRYCVNTLVQNGFEFAFNGKQGVNYRAEEEGTGQLYSVSYIYIQKNYTKGYVRMRSTIGGLDF